MHSLAADYPHQSRSQESMKLALQSKGVTLLEIMLVLAIAAIIIVMSVRYYQSTTNAQQAHAFIAQMQAIQAALDQTAEATHTYTRSNASIDILKNLLGDKILQLTLGR